MSIEYQRPNNSIVVPATYTIKLCLRGREAFVVAAPAGIEPTPEGLIAPGTAAGLFTHDPDVAWPDKAGVVAANSYLAAGWPICLVFPKMGDALACHARLTREQAA